MTKRGLCYDIVRLPLWAALVMIGVVIDVLTREPTK